jgi:hypothetical protein
MYYVIAFLAGVVVGATACWIYKDKAIKKLKEAANTAATKASTL